MATEVAELITKMVLDVSGFNSKLKSAEENIEHFGSRTRSVFGKVAAAAGGLFIGHEFLEGLKTTVERSDQLYLSTKKLGIGAESLQQLQFAAKEAGVEGGQLNSVILGLTKTLGTLESGGKGADNIKSILSSLKLDPASFKGKDIGDSVITIVDALKKVDDQALRTKDTSVLFAKGWKDAISLVNSDFQENIGESKKLTVGLDSEQLKEMHELVSEYNKMSETLQRDAMKAVVALKPLFEGLAAGFKYIGTTIGETLAKLVSVATDLFNKANNLISKIPGSSYLSDNNISSGIGNVLHGSLSTPGANYNPNDLSKAIEIKITTSEGLKASITNSAVLKAKVISIVQENIADAASGAGK
jgi:hypothetical protein